MAAAVRPLRPVETPAAEAATIPSPPHLARLWTAIGLVLIVAVLALVAGPGRGLRGDIAIQKQLITEQVDVTRSQLEITRTQLEITQRQLRLAEDQLAIATETRNIAKEQLAIAKTQLQRSDETIALQRQLLAIAQETRDVAREINRKTVDPTPLDR